MDETPTHEAPTRVNGYPVVKAVESPRGGYVILVDRGEQYHRWVTAFMPRGMVGEWCWGNYLRDRGDAEADFNDRCKRGF
jgi:hypothetical protein